MKKFLLIAFGFLFFDQIVKNILMFTFSFNSSVSIIPNFFSITLVKNTGAAFSVLSSSTIFLVLVGIIALVLLYVFFIKDKDLSIIENFLYGALAGGILGNMIDRIIRGYVIDYLDFNIFGYNFPVFNVADICITVSIFILIIFIFKGDENEISSK